MRKRNKKIPPNAQKSQPIMEWQTGEFERHGTYHVAIPYQLLLLCKLMELSPRQLLIDFMDNLSCGSWKREGKEISKEKLLEYFLEQGYGQDIYSKNDIITMFSEMDAIGMLYPKDAPPALVEQHIQWRENYHAYWFNKWFRKFNREI